MITEAGDQDRRSALRGVSERGGGSAFSANQVNALVSGEVDVIVHSLKDLPTANPPGLILLPPPARADVHDALCGSTLADLRHSGRVGSSASRRIAQLLHVRPDLVPAEIRGNVPTRLGKLRTQMAGRAVPARPGAGRAGARVVAAACSLDWGHGARTWWQGGRAPFRR
ncbi:hypothetical protein [Kitasatospora purpeofusca]|uniref:hypothetical protein n=1 Tax=Kitasatospora purpeofusca TaxID=67352 RepID=UPI002A599022|nr:hypothetical protein [Kitasatospora purpeofusca]MDY0815736.1 hypothetical protein [Kitasatospora purpeofusca]